VIRPIQIIFLVAVLATLVSLVVVIFLIRSRIPAEELEDEADSKEEVKPEVKMEAAARDETRDKSAWQVMKEVTSEKVFWIFMAFIFLLVLVKMIFQYNHSLYPLYMERIGLSNWTGKLYSINPFLIILLVPIATAITQNMKPYHVITIGSFIAAGSVFFMGFGEAISLIVMYQVVLSIGEAVYSPLIYEYTAKVAPPGKEASYMAYSKAPMFFAKVAAGPITGLLLMHLCPEGSTEPQRNTELMWIIVGISTMISPITLLLAKRWLDIPSRRKRGDRSVMTKEMYEQYQARQARGEEEPDW
jgi:MFS family permease